MSNKFIYYNANPYKIEEEDCVIRAIKAGLNLPYDTVDKLLDLSAEKNKCDKLCVCCYHFLLEDIFGLPVRYCKNYETVEDIARLYPHNKCIIRINGHLSCSINGKIYDLWDCTQKLVDCYWII